MGAFATAVTPSWYALARSTDLRSGDVKPVMVGERKLAVWRDGGGAARVLDARCPHLGGDLAAGRVEGDLLVCPFHGWKIDGRGFSVPGARSTRCFPVEEKFGLVWAWVGGPEPFALPEVPPEFRPILLPETRVQAHPHLVIGNGLDALHYDTVHDLVFSEPPRFERDGGTCALHFKGSPRSSLLRWISGTAQRPLEAVFRTFGGNLALATVSAPVQFQMLFTGRPEGGACVSRGVLFVTGGLRSWFRSAVIMHKLLARDVKVLEGLDFRRAFTEEDEALAGFAAAVDALGEV